MQFWLEELTRVPVRLIACTTHGPSSRNRRVFTASAEWSSIFALWASIRVRMGVRSLEPLPKHIHVRTHLGAERYPQESLLNAIANYSVALALSLHRSSFLLRLNKHFSICASKKLLVDFTMKFIFVTRSTLNSKDTTVSQTNGSYFFYFIFNKYKSKNYY